MQQVVDLTTMRKRASRLTEVCGAQCRAHDIEQYKEILALSYKEAFGNAVLKFLQQREFINE